MTRKLQTAIIHRIAQAGLRPTTARVAIVHSLDETRDHPTADELTLRLTRSGHRIGRATVYQNLDKMVEAGVIACLTAGDGLRRFDATLEPHQHFIDSATGRIYDVLVEPALLKKLRPIDPATGKALKNARVGEVRVQFYGRA
jgi:Fur family transcriptional regulator, peroxide stress response regulator